MSIMFFIRDWKWTLLVCSVVAKYRFAAHLFVPKPPCFLCYMLMCLNKILLQLFHPPYNAGFEPRMVQGSWRWPLHQVLADTVQPPAFQGISTANSWRCCSNSLNTSPIQKGFEMNITRLHSRENRNTEGKESIKIFPLQGPQLRHHFPLSNSIINRVVQAKMRSRNLHQSPFLFGLLPATSLISAV